VAGELKGRTGPVFFHANWRSGFVDYSVKSVTYFVRDKQWFSYFHNGKVSPNRISLIELYCRKRVGGQTQWN
jgi:hypothetical protein